LLTLRDDECLLVADLSLNFFEEQVESLLFVVTDYLELLQEAINVLWWVNLNVMLFALTL
jgi:hypothetical protein